MSEQKQPIERILDANDDAFLIVSTKGEGKYCVELHGSSEPDVEPVCEFTGESIEEAYGKLETFIEHQVDRSFGNAFWEDIEIERED